MNFDPAFPGKRRNTFIVPAHAAAAEHDHGIGVFVVERGVERCGAEHLAAACSDHARQKREQWLLALPNGDERDLRHAHRNFFHAKRFEHGNVDRAQPFARLRK